eukprot:11013952-Alexandrium_andersonii.AAC.1
MISWRSAIQAILWVVAVRTTLDGLERAGHSLWDSHFPPMLTLAGTHPSAGRRLVGGLREEIVQGGRSCSTPFPPFGTSASAQGKVARTA